MNVPFWIAWIVVALFAGVAFVARVWLKSVVEGQVQVSVERQAEGIRSEIRRSEERLKSDLRTREAEIQALRDGVLSGRANRLALIDKRRLEAVERVWIAVSKLTRMKGPAMALSVLKYDAVAKRAPTDSKLRELLKMMSETFGGKDFEEKMAELKADHERPFISDMSWALYAAYSTIIVSGWAILKILAIGIEKPDELIKRDHASNLLKTALPEYASYIDEHKEAAHYYLLEKLEAKILLELRHSLEGPQVDAENIRRSTEIMSEVSKANAALENLNRSGSDREGLRATGAPA